MLDHFFNFSRKLLVGTIALIFAFVVVYTPQEYGNRDNFTTIPEAQAFIGSAAVVAAVTAVGVVITQGLVIKETALDPIAWAIAKSIVSQITADLVQWINSGFKGSPAFIQDLDNFLLQAADKAAGAYIESLGDVGSFLCSPFKLDIQIALAIEYDDIRAKRPYEGCTLSGIVGNFEEFIEGNFEEGGWENWITITAEPAKYTPYGQLLEGKQGLRERIAEKENEESLKSVWTGGFRSAEICEDIESAEVPVEVLKDNKPIDIQPVEIDVGDIPDVQGALPSGSTFVQKTLPDARPLTQGSVTSRKERCVISTPGRIISEQLTKALGAGQDTLVTADEISEIIGALIAQLANKAVTGVNGLLGLSGGTGYTYSGYASGSYLGDAVRESTGTEASASGLQSMQATLDVQENILALAGVSRPLIQTYLSSRSISADSRKLAEEALREVGQVEQQTPALISTLQDQISSYQRLESEYLANTTSTNRRTAIRQEQMTILSTFGRTGYYTQGQLDAARSNWDTRNF